MQRCAFRPRTIEPIAVGIKKLWNTFDAAHGLKATDFAPRQNPCKRLRPPWCSADHTTDDTCVGFACKIACASFGKYIAFKDGGFHKLRYAVTFCGYINIWVLSHKVPLAACVPSIKFDDTVRLLQSCE